MTMMFGLSLTPGPGFSGMITRGTAGARQLRTLPDAEGKDSAAQNCAFIPDPVVFPEFLPCVPA